MKCFYHNDLDGQCAGAITHMKNPKAELFSIDYRDDFPFTQIDKDESISIVDYSLQKSGDWNTLLNITRNVIWIDHHVTAIERAKDTDAEQLSGLRNDGKESAAMLAWRFWFPQKADRPLAISYVSQWDTWTHNDNPLVLEFVAGMKAQDSRPTSPVWTTLLGDDLSVAITELASIQQQGQTIMRFEETQNAEYIKNFAFFCKLPGLEWRVVACNKGMTNSKLFDSADYDIAAPFVFDGKQYTVSLYTKRDDIRVCDIAKEYGGGGHPKAAGFQCKELPFVR